ncbi:MAG: hypothetical protein WCP29_01630 [Acidobacteriota bacterium]
MVVRPLIPVRVVLLGVVALTAFVTGALGPEVAAAQTTPAKPTVAAKPTPVPSKPAAAPVPAAVVPKAEVAPRAAAAATTAKTSLAALAGAWDGIATTPGGDMPIHVVLAYQGGTLTGAIESQLGTIGVTGAALSGEALELGIDMQGASGSLSGKIAGDKYEGLWSVNGETGPFAVTRVAGGSAKPAGPAASADPISGDWSGDVSIGGQIMAFTLTLTLKGEAVAGDISSAAGTVPLTSGRWRDGMLELVFPYMSGEAVSMAGKIADGKLTGTVDYNKGEMQGTWAAVKK